MMAYHEADSSQPAADMAVDLFDNWFDPIETEVRARSRQFIEELLRGELDAALARPRYERSQMAGNEGRAGVAGHRPRQPHAIADRHVRANRDCGAARPADHVRGRDDGMEEPGAAGLSAADACRRRADREHLSRRHQYEAGASRADGVVRRDHRQGHREPNVAQSEERLGYREHPLAGRGSDCAPDPRRHRGSRAARPQGDLDLAPRCPRRARGRPAKVLLAIKSMGGESAEAWRTVLDDLIKRGLRRPELLFIRAQARRGWTRPSRAGLGRSAGATFHGSRGTAETCSRMPPSACMTRSPRRSVLGRWDHGVLRRPVPCPDPAERAVKMAMAMRQAAGKLIAESAPPRLRAWFWRRYCARLRDPAADRLFRTVAGCTRNRYGMQPRGPALC